ncbi:Lrp/AsnC family transcriptional regulator [Microbacterium lushaniae]|uniref:Lrp/AsnC family transcriptional regulator n=1 Tax=Microbacterium lushaniae TaxID=2614639 RepID=A0A5J6L131_9MICO|nr:Lrp/AsnC family transcriptional regulator [Microbacterium lushaniae]QEW02171.1 Lrp/AsnC family transcriptional regulator [Microbacterium lushaniae]
MGSGALDQLSDLDKRIVVALQHDGRASWRAIADRIGASVSTVSRRGPQLLADGLLRVVAVPALGADGAHSQFLVRINCQPGTHMEVAEELVRNPFVRFCTIVTGSYDIIAELVVRGAATRYPQVIVDLQPIAGVQRWRSDLIMHVYKVSYDWGRQLFGGLLEIPPTEGDGEELPAEGCTPEHLDDVDREILAILREDGRESFQSVGEKLGLNESSVRRRFDRLRSNRCVDILTLVPSAALGMESETFLTVTVEPSRMDAVARELAKYPFVRYLAALLDENALLCEVITTSVDELYGFVTDSLAHLDGVQGWTANMELLFLKRGFVETPWWRTQIEQSRTTLSS